MSRRILFDKKRHNGKVDDTKINALIEGLTVAEVMNFIDSAAHKVHGLRNASIETDATALDELVLKNEGFDIAYNHSITFGDYTLWRKNLDGSKALLKLGSYSNKYEEIAMADQLEAYLNKFGGKDNLYVGELSQSKKEEYYIKSIQELDAMSWTDLKNYLKQYNIDGLYDLRSENLTRTALYDNINQGYYDQERK